MSKFRLTGWFAITFCVLSTIAIGAESDTRPPNVLLIIGDDQAWTDFGFVGHDVVQTPNLDRFAAESLVYRRGYGPTSLCRASLMTLLTGRFPHQHGITGNDPPRGTDRNEMLRFIEQQETLPERLAKRGYVSLQTGKWWEGNYSVGGFSAGMTHGDPTRGGRHGDEGLKIGREGLKPIFDFIEHSGDKPWFVWYAPMMPHTPHNPPARLLDKYKSPDRPIEIARYYAMIEWFDETCGELFGHLDQHQLAKDTLVVFVTDNGWIQRTSDMQLPPDWKTPFAPRSKRSPYEGGIRTPIMIRGPGVSSGSVDVPVSSVDIVPTILAAANVEQNDLPGVNLLNSANEKIKSRAAVFGEIYSHDMPNLAQSTAGLEYRWCVAGKWKLILPVQSEQSTELYDVVADPFEKENLADRHPEKVAELKARIDEWWKK